MEIIPPQLIFDKQRYYSDLDYRTEVDWEILGDRAERIAQLMHEHLFQDSSLLKGKYG